MDDGLRFPILCLVGKSGLWIYTQQRGSLGAQPQPLTTATSVLSDWSYAGAGIPRLTAHRTRRQTDRHTDIGWLGFISPLH